MTKLMTIFNTKEITDELLLYTDAVILGINGLSINLPVYFEINEIEQLVYEINSKGKEVFISLNKNMRNSDLEFLKEVLIKIDNMNIKGILYYDIALVNLKNKLNIKKDLVWSQEHLTTNYYTINYWMSKGSKYTLISSEITLEEIVSIRKNTSSQLIVPVFGYQPMFTSFRQIVANYKDYFNLYDDSKINYIEKEGKIYPIIDNNNGTIVYSNNILNGLEEYLKFKEINIEYILLNGFNIDNKKFVDILKMFNEVNSINVLEYNQRINDMLKNTDKGFLYKETVYKVK